MNQKAALCAALLAGETLSIMDGFKKLGITNLPREISRSIEGDFLVIVSRTPKTKRTRYGTKCHYYEYSLPKNWANKAGIEKMQAYVKAQRENFKSVKGSYYTTPAKA